MHVGIFVPALRGGGAEFVVRRWVGELDALDHEVTVYIYNREQLPATIPARVVVRRFHPRWRGARHLTLPLWLHRHLRVDKPDVVLSLMTYGNVVALLLWSIFRYENMPLSISERNMPSLKYGDARGLDRVTLWLARHLYARADRVIAISHPVGGDLVSAFGVSPERLHVVANPVIANVHADHSASARPQTTSSLNIGFVGRLVEQKRPTLFLAVLHTLGERGVKVHGTIIGDGPLRDVVEREAHEQKLDVTFAGWQEPWWEAVSDLDCVAVTASYEGLANVLIEAAAAEIPSVASSRALGVADAIVPGITGELAVTDEPSAYADAIVRACSNARPSSDRIQGWLNHFSTKRSTETLMSALACAREHASADMPPRRR